MNTDRLEAFSDGVIAILITILVLEFKIPRSGDFEALRPLFPTFLAYVLSFIYLGIYWTNHHHLLHTMTRVSGKILWANLHLLFWLSLVPFVTGWLGENHLESLPTALYGLVLFLAALAWRVLEWTIISVHGDDSTLARAVGVDLKVYLSMLLYASAIALAFYLPHLADALYAVVAFMWLVPDRRIERTLAE